MIVRTFILSPDVVETLVRLSRDASTLLGRAVSGSAIVRALVRQVDQQGPPAVDALFLVVEKEMKGGVTWGRRKSDIAPMSSGTRPNDAAE
jgi:hypothetical protein